MYGCNPTTTLRLLPLAGSIVDLGIARLGPGSPVGGGGSAVVFSSVQPADGVAVAVKVFRLTVADYRTRRQFEREAAASGN